MVSSIVEIKASNYKKVAGQQVWRNAMVVEYASIMKNDVREIMPRPEGKSVVTLRWLYKIKYVVDGSIKKFKAQFVAQDSHS